MLAAGEGLLDRTLGLVLQCSVWVAGVGIFLNLCLL